MDRTLDVRTPESIAFKYDLAGLGSRALALVVDQAIQILVLVGIVVALAQYGAHEAPHHATPGTAAKVAESTLVAVVVGILFVVLFGYFIIFEAVWNGQTPGKKLLGLRVVRDGGYPIDFAASLIRNLIRVGELLAGYYLIAGISMLLSPENKRIGDHAAGTIVVRESALPEPRAVSVPAAPALRAAVYVNAEERALIARFLERRDELTPARRRELAERLALRVRPRVPEDLARLNDEDLLERASS